MKTVRMLSVWASVLGLLFALLAPTPALAQRVIVFDGTSYALCVPAAPNQEVRVTVVDDRPVPRPAITVELVNVRTREAQIVNVYPGFTGGVRVAAGDLD